MTMISWEVSAIQKGAEAIGLPDSPCEKSHFPASGKTLSGPILLGAVARATITQTEPMICENAKVAQTCSRDSVCGPTISISVTYDWNENYGNLPEGESYPGQHLEWHPKLPTTAKGICRGKGLPCPPMGGIGQGKMYPRASTQFQLSNLPSELETVTLLTWHHLGAPRPTANTASSHVCVLLKWVRTANIAAQTPTKKRTINTAICHLGMGTAQRKPQLRP